VYVPGFRPTAHFILDSRHLPADILAAVENILYGGSARYEDVVYDGGYADSDPGYIDGMSSDSDVIDESSPEFVIDGEDSVLLEDHVIEGGYSYSVGIELPDQVLVEETHPRLPPISELIGLVAFWGPRVIVPNETTGLAGLGYTDEGGDVTQTGIAGIYTGLSTNRLVGTSTAGIYRLS